MPAAWGGQRPGWQEVGIVLIHHSVVRLTHQYLLSDFSGPEIALGMGIIKSVKIPAFMGLIFYQEGLTISKVSK